MTTWRDIAQEEGTKHADEIFKRFELGGAFVILTRQELAEYLAIAFENGVKRSGAPELKG